MYTYPYMAPNQYKKPTTYQLRSFPTNSNSLPTPSLILIGWEGGIVIYTIVIYGTKKAKPYTEYRQPAVQMMIKTQTAQHKVPIESDKGEPKHENN